MALAAVAIGLLHLPADPWVRAFLHIAVLYVTTSAFTLATGDGRRRSRRGG